MYRPPDSNVNKCFNALNSLTEYLDYSSNVIFIGEFNIDMFKKNNSTINLPSYIKQLSLKYLIDVPTDQTALNILVSEKLLNGNCLSIKVSSNGLSDHRGIM